MAKSPWIEAMRIRTLPVSIAGVLGGTACAIHNHGFNLLPFLICLFFALIAQIASNFANEYYDFKNGLDKKGREGFRRGVTEGDISPHDMKRATYSLLVIDALLGCSLIIWGGWWIIIPGIMIFIFALAYSAGPYPLSHHGLGDVAVVIFFGIIPVVFTEYVQTGTFPTGYMTWFTSLAIGLLAANVLIVNNYRDMEEDKEVGKKTTVVIFGRTFMSYIYLLNGIVCAILLAMASSTLPYWVSAGWLGFLTFHISLWTKLKTLRGAPLNNILKYTAIILMLLSIYILIVYSIEPQNLSFPDYNL